MKNALKEIFIILLLCIAIALIFAVIFYEYNPMTKEVPEPIAYKMPEELKEVKEELEVPLINDEEKVIKTYELTETELKAYQKINYDAGKVNPFEIYVENNTTDNNVDSTENNIIKNSITNNSATNSNSTGTFFENSSTK